ncbi:ribosome biogenesis GTP-binding protein YihA/YsxC [Acutalibacter intestini]|uniref:ribosome biogenesis GTP-binding protein YihA/YsxC n=1 Tax=Acutalibacter intestini TaxID=3093659 RepID=UPI002AC93B66|nr:ribosome biogenesis GTP-binding protein YihA/YsxC [Acutalibacter sp. M00204]
MNYLKAEFELAAGTASQLPEPQLPEIVFSGRSNVGKSSLLNKLVNRKALARTSATPGKTATINFYRLDKCRFVDLPGYGYARVAKSEKDRWASLVNGYFAQERPVALVLQLVDMRHQPTADDMQMIDFLSSSGYRFAIVCTKMDKLNQGQAKGQMQLFTDIFGSRSITFYPFSATKGTGVSEVRLSIAKSIAPKELENNSIRGLRI